MEAATLVHPCLHDLFRQQAETHPDAVAVAMADRTVNYAELEAMSARVLSELQRHDVQPEQRIAIWATRAAETAAAVLGTVRAGACCVLLDETIPTQRLSHIVERTSARILLVPESVQPTVPTGLMSLCVSHSDSASSVSVRDVTVHPDSLAHVIYTSGSTGWPKGAALTHRSIATSARAMCERTGIGLGDRMLLQAPVTFDVWCLEFYVALLSGGCLQMLPRGATAPGLAVVGTFREQRTTAMVAVPSVLGALPRAALPDLRTIIVGGEPLPADLACHWGSGRRLFNCYGLTECGMASSGHEVTPDQTEPVPIGTALSNATLLVVDDDLRPCGVAEEGELVIAGPGLARGYLDDPAATGARFVPDPRGTGGRAYRTGDLVCLRPDGELEFRGRLDHQVKVRGVRVEPAEIEAAARLHPALEEIAVVPARLDGELRLVAHVVPRSGAQLSAEALLDFLRERLPDAMVPASVVFAAALPKTGHGKVDRRALMAAPAREPREARVEHQSPMEAALAGMLAQLLKRDQIGLDDNVFEFGIHSLLAARVAVLVRDVFGVEIDVGSVLKTPTVRELAALVGRRKEALEAPLAEPVGAR
jgi:amino acid adenylation domain-containing protein